MTTTARKHHHSWSAATVGWRIGLGTILVESCPCRAERLTSRTRTLIHH